MKTIVISLGGSVLTPSLEENRVAVYAEVLRAISQVYKTFVVIGGGGEARRFISAARALGADEATADEIGIMVTRLNATLLMIALGNEVYPRVAESPREAVEYAYKSDLVVAGGVTPGQTTDTVAAVIAEESHASCIINLTSVDGIYSDDPKLVKNAEKFSELTPEELSLIVGKTPLCAGSNTVFDSVAVKILARSHIPLLVLDGRDPDTLQKAVLCGSHRGTIVRSPEINLPF